MGKRRGFVAGAWEAFGFMGFTSEVARLVMVQKIKETQEYKKMGYENWDDFCNEQLRCSGRSIEQKLKLINETNPHFVSTCRELGFEWREIRLLTDSQKDNIKQEFLLIEDKKVAITSENADVIKLYTGNLEKDQKLTASKLSGIEREHKKELKAYQEEIAHLQTQIASEEIPENTLKRMEALDKLLDQFTRESVFAFSPGLQEDLVTAGKINNIIDDMYSRVNHLRVRWDKFYTGEDV